MQAKKAPAKNARTKTAMAPSLPSSDSDESDVFSPSSDSDESASPLAKQMKRGAGKNALAKNARARAKTAMAPSPLSSDSDESAVFSPSSDSDESASPLAKRMKRGAGKKPSSKHGKKSSKRNAVQAKKAPPGKNAKRTTEKVCPLTLLLPMNSYIFLSMNSY